MTLRERFKWMLEHCGYRVGYHAIDALALARAEQYADNNDWVYEWEDDTCADLSWWDEDKPIPDNLRVDICVLWDICPECSAKTTPLASLGGISYYDYDDDYPRLIEAELALEAIT